MVHGVGIEPTVSCMSRKRSAADLPVHGGSNRSRTGHLLSAEQALSQMSYGPRSAPPRSRTEFSGFSDRRLDRFGLRSKCVWRVLEEPRLMSSFRRPRDPSYSARAKTEDNTRRL